MKTLLLPIIGITMAICSCEPGQNSKDTSKIVTLEGTPFRVTEYYYGGKSLRKVSFTTDGFAGSLQKKTDGLRFAEFDGSGMMPIMTPDQLSAAGKILRAYQEKLQTK